MVTGSSTYDWILEQGLQKGRLIEARRLLLVVGTGKLGEPDEASVAAVEAIQDVERLEELGVRLYGTSIQNWCELLQGS